ncbi:MAG: hypothetical protein J6A15_08930 [Clostridia bacterium]|nr:hypothetical protein [Clostridia bacterium]
MKKKKMNGFLKALIYLGILVVLFVATILGTKYYFYDSDFAVKKTDLSAVSVDDIKLGMNINDIDLSKYTQTEIVVDDCNYNYEELSIKTDDEGDIIYIVADFKEIDLFVGQDENATKIKKVNEIWKTLGSNHKEELYKPEENNYRKISRYLDTENDIYIGLIYSRYNNEMLEVVVSNQRIK